MKTRNHAGSPHIRHIRELIGSLSIAINLGFKPFLSSDTSTISQWIKLTLGEAGIDTTSINRIAPEQHLPRQQQSIRHRL